MPNLANPNDSPPPAPGEDNKQPGIMATVITLTALADLVVCLRLITRKWIVKCIGWDDWTIVAATLGVTMGCALVVVEVHYGFGRHKTDLSQESYLEYVRYSYGEWIQTFATLMFTKVSICLFLLRIVMGKAFVRSLQALIIVLVLSNIVLTIIWILQCRPVYLAWVTLEEPLSYFTEVELQRIILAQAIISIASDFIFATYPIFILRKVQMPLRVKAGLCDLMGLGAITGACYMVRTIGNWQNVNDDPTWNSVDNWYWRSWEVFVGIIAACAPALRPGYKSLRVKIRSYSHPHSGRDTSARVQTEKITKPSCTGNTDSFRGVPRAALRPDRGEANVICTTATSDDRPHLPPQTMGIMKITNVDLESQRTISDDNLTGSNSEDKIDRTDSQTELDPPLPSIQLEKVQVH